MSMRYMVKLFLSHYWQKTRELKGLPVERSYAVEHVQGHEHTIQPLYDRPLKEVVV